MPSTDEFTAQDFAPEFTQEDFAPEPEAPTQAFKGIKLSPFEIAKMEPQIGPPPSLTGPAHPEEILTAPLAAIQAPGAIAQEALFDPIAKMAEDWRLRMGIPTQGGFGPQPITDIPGTGGLSIARAIAPEFTRGVEEKAGELANAFVAPGMPEMLPIAPLKGVQAAFGLQSLAAIPESIREAYQAKTARELGSALTGGAANLGIGAAIAGHLLPRTASEFLNAADRELLAKTGDPLYAQTIREDPGQLVKKGEIAEGGEAYRGGDIQQGAPGAPNAPAPVAQEAPLPLKQASLLTPEEEAYIEAERKAIDVDVEITPELPGNAPFAGQIATIDRNRGSILINPSEFSAWLKTVPEKRRSNAVKSLVNEERIHLAVDDAAAFDYWNTLTDLEKAIAKRRYAPGKLGAGLSDLDFGHEALRYRLQQLARMTPREIAEAAFKERWTIHMLDAVEGAVRNVRQLFGTEASKTALLILDQIQDNIDTGRMFLSGSSPEAIRKKGRTDIFTEQMDLPPMQPGAERPDVRAQPTGLAVQSAAEQYFKEPTGTAKRTIMTGFGQEKAEQLRAEGSKQVAERTQITAKSKAPTFDEFFGQLRSQFGPTVPREAAFDAWNDALAKSLMNATGAQLQDMVSQLGLSKDIAEALRPNLREPYMGKIADPIAPVQREFAEQYGSSIPASRRLEQMRKKARKDPGQETRMAAIGAIMDKLVGTSGVERKLPSLDRKAVGPEDLMQRYNVIEGAGETETGEPTPFQVSSGTDWHTFAPEERTNPQAVAERVLRRGGPRKMGEAVSTSRALVALKDKVSGKISLVSAWKDGRRGPVVENPITGSSRQIDAKLLNQFEPMATMMLRDPVSHFRQVFDTQEAFDQHFGDLATGTPGLRTSSFVGPQAGLANVQAGIEFTPEDFTATRGVPYGTPTKTLQQLQGQHTTAGAGVLPGLPRRQPASIQEIARLRAQRQALPGVSESGARELTYPRATVPTMIPGETLPKGPGPVPTLPTPQPPAKLSPEAQMRVAKGALEAFPDVGVGTGEMPIAPSTGRITTYGKPKPMGPGWPLRAGTTAKRTPAALNKNAQVARDSLKVVGDALVAGVKRGPVKNAIAAGRDAADFNEAVSSWSAGQAIRVASTKDLPGGVTKTGYWSVRTPKGVRAEVAEAKMRREAGIAYIAAGGDLNKVTVGTPAKGARPAVPSLEDQLAYARQRSTLWETDPNPLKRAQGRKDTAYIQKLYEGLQYAKAHWNDPEFKNAAEQYKLEMENEINWEKARGMRVEHHENYIPQRYEGTFWMDSTLGRRILGTQFRGRKTYSSPYEAIRYGPFRMVTLDLAELAEHRVHQGLRNVEVDDWFRGLRQVNDPVSGKPIAVDPIIHKDIDPLTGDQKTYYASPSNDYTLVYPRPNSAPLAIRYGFKTAVEALTLPSNILGKAIPFSDELDAANAMLKHGAILVWDAFHLGRVSQYAQSMMGFKRVGWRAGMAALKFRPGDLDAAVRKGLISKEAADWAKEPIQMGKNLTLTRQQILMQLGDRGFNVARVVDAIYQDAAGHLPGVGRVYNKLIAPWNTGLFQNFIPGVMAEAAVENAIRMRKANPNVPLSALLRDVAKDTNIMFGNMGRQGIFRSKAFQQFGRLFFLAPMWQEGLFQKEARFLSRSALAGTRAVGLDLPYRRGLPAMGTLGTAMGRGLFAYFVGTQIINMITRGKPTWQNPEKEHKMDAWVPLAGKGGFWISPMAVFGEITHDIIRLGQTKRNAWEVVKQMGENRLGPVGKMLSIFHSGESPTGEHYSTTGGVAWGMASQVIPFAGASPITVAPIARAIGHAVAPNLVAPNAPGRLARQVIATSTGIKVEPAKNSTQEMGMITRRFIRDNHLEKSEGWMQVQTDLPSYSKLRTAIRNDDVKGAKYNLQELRKHHTDGQIRQAMNLWARRPWTGSHQNDSALMQSMSNDEIETMHEADLERMDVLNKFGEFIRKN